MALFERPELPIDPLGEIQQLVNTVRRYGNPIAWWTGYWRGDTTQLQQDEQQKPGQKPMRQAIEAAAVTEGINLWRDRVLTSASLIQFGGVAAAVGNLLSPQGPGCCDHNHTERAANIVTSLPYLAIGVDSYRRRNTAAGKVWAASMCGVGIGSMTFHSSAGRWRQWGRRLDYWAIALSSCMLTRAVFPDLPPLATALGVAATPFRPFAVSTVNTLAMELRFLQRAMQQPKLRSAQRIHSAAALASMGLFMLEDHQPHLPFIHASWHCLSALGCQKINAVLEDAEQQHPENTLSGLSELPVTPLRV